MILAVPDFAGLKGNPEWEKLAKDLENDYFEKNPSVNQEVLRSLCQINIEDQSIRGIRADIREIMVKDPSNSIR